MNTPHSFEKSVSPPELLFDQQKQATRNRIYELCLFGGGALTYLVGGYIFDDELRKYADNKSLVRDLDAIGGLKSMISLHNWTILPRTEKDRAVNQAIQGQIDDSYTIFVKNCTTIGLNPTHLNNPRKYLHTMAQQKQNISDCTQKEPQ